MILATLARELTIDLPAALDGWQVAFLPPDPHALGRTRPSIRTIELYPRRGYTTRVMAWVLAHELGHRLDLAYLTDPSRARWRHLRGFEPSSPWFDLVTDPLDSSVPSEDWADAIADTITTPRARIEAHRHWPDIPPLADAELAEIRTVLTEAQGQRTMTDLVVRQAPEHLPAILARAAELEPTPSTTVPQLVARAAVELDVPRDTLAAVGAWLRESGQTAGVGLEAQRTIRDALVTVQRFTLDEIEQRPDGSTIHRRVSGERIEAIIPPGVEYSLGTDAFEPLDHRTVSAGAPPASPDSGRLAELEARLAMVVEHQAQLSDQLLEVDRGLTQAIHVLTQVARRGMPAGAPAPGQIGAGQ